MSHFDTIIEARRVLTKFGNNLLKWEKNKGINEEKRNELKKIQSALDYAARLEKENDKLLQDKSDILLAIGNLKTQLKESRERVAVLEKMEGISYKDFIKELKDSISEA